MTVEENRQYKRIWARKYRARIANKCEFCRFYLDSEYHQIFPCGTVPIFHENYRDNWDSFIIEIWGYGTVATLTY